MSALESTLSSTDPPANVAVIYHSRKGTQHALAAAAAAGAQGTGADVRLLRIPAIDVEPGPAADGGQPSAPTLDDLIWADGIVWGTPTYFGNVAAPVKRFIDSASVLWPKGLLANCAVTGMTSSTSFNGGQEATLLGLYRSMYHWGALVMSADSVPPRWESTRGNPFGLSVCAGSGEILDAEERAAHGVGRSIALLAERAHSMRDRVRGLDTPDPRPVGGMRIAVFFQDGHPALWEMAEAVAAGIRDAGGEVRLRRLRPMSSGGPDRDPATAPVPIAVPEDVAWADGLVWGARPAAGSMPADLIHFIQATEAALPARQYSKKTVTAFGATADAHAGGESMVLSVYTAMHTWAALIVAPGYTDPAVATAGGNPYGAVHCALNGPRKHDILTAAQHQGYRLATVTQRIGPADPPH